MVYTRTVVFPIESSVVVRLGRHAWCHRPERQCITVGQARHPSHQCPGCGGYEKGLVVSIVFELPTVLWTQSCSNRGPVRWTSISWHWHKTLHCCLVDHLILVGLICVLLNTRETILRCEWWTCSTFHNTKREIYIKDSWYNRGWCRILSPISEQSQNIERLEIFQMQTWKSCWIFPTRTLCVLYGVSFTTNSSGDKTKTIF